jgi:hypothetical protein
MSKRHPACGVAWILAILVWLTTTAAAQAAPRITNLSLRGLSTISPTTVVVDGNELGPDTRVWFSAPGAKPVVKDGATHERLEIEFTLDPQTPSGLYVLRIASASGISDAAAVAVDAMPQLPFGPQISAGRAMTGTISGSAVLATSFAGKKGQQVAIEVESHRLGSALDPVIHLYDARRAQLAWSPAVASIADDARCLVTLPADGEFTIEIHDALYRGGNPGFFRLKFGEFHFADAVYPLAVERGASASFEFSSSNLPPAARSNAAWSAVEGPAEIFKPVPWPGGIRTISGTRPVVIVSHHAELVEPPAGAPLPELVAPPVGVSGRIATAGEQDRFRIPVSSGAKLRFDVLARRANSALDGVLSIQNEQGAELAGNDDRPRTSDPGLDFTVPDGVAAIVVVLRDLEGRGGADYFYRLSVTPIAPDFKLTLNEAAYQVPKDGAALAIVRVQRAGYAGSIKLGFENLPSGLSVTPDEIPAGVDEAFLTLAAPGLSHAQSIAVLLGSSTEPNTAIKRAGTVPPNSVNKYQPWLADDIAIAVTDPSPLNLVWDSLGTDARLAVGTALPLKFRVERAAGVAGPVRLALMTTQPMPRKKVKVNNQDRDVDDLDRAIRFEGAPVLAADQSELTAKVLIPADLPSLAYDLAVRAELLNDTGKNVIAATVAPSRRLTTTSPLVLELAGTGPIEARAGLGPTGKLAGKVQRLGGFVAPVQVTLEGLPTGLTAPALTLAADKSDFELPLAFPYGTPSGDLANVKLVATSQYDAKNPKAILKANEIPVAIKIVPGDKPPPEKPLAVFEDQVDFLANLNQGGGKASLIADEKYSGLVSVRVTPDQRFNPALPGLGVKIRKQPGPGEYRYVRFAWKKQGGAGICLQLNHDGQWGATADNPAKFRYHAGPAGECYGGSVAVDVNLPSAFTVVTRDLAADFGEFTLSGIALSAVDGEYGLFDHIYLGRAPDDFELVKP